MTPEPAPATAIPTETPASSATEAAAAASGGGGAPSEEGGQQLVLKVLGTVATGIGVLGFVTFFGGAILWLRASESDLPANDVVAAIPNSVLVTTGASFLVPAVLLALLAVAVIFVARLASQLLRKGKLRLKFDEARVQLYEAEELGRHTAAATQYAQAVRAQATHHTDLAEQLAADATVPEARKAAAAAAAKAKRLQAEEAEAEALREAAEATTKKAAAENLQASSQFALQRTHGQFLIELGVGAVVLVAFPPAVNQAVFHLPFFWDGAILTGVGLLAATISLVAYMFTEKFVWFGIVAFVTVGAYIGTATVFSTINNPKVEPAAALRTGHAPVVGSFIADTSTSLYLGSFSKPGEPPHLVVIPRAEITDLAIGPLLDPDKAEVRAEAIARQQCAQPIAKPAAPAPTGAGSPATGAGSAATAAGSGTQAGEPASGSESPAEAGSAKVEKPAPPVEEPACTPGQLKTLGS